MLKIRLRKTGRKNINTFRIIVVHATAKRDTLNYIEDLGYYHPADKENYTTLNTERYQHWIKNGAQPTLRVQKLFKIQSKKSA